jgi:cyanophycin synthetase
MIERDEQAAAGSRAPRPLPPPLPSEATIAADGSGNARDGNGAAPLSARRKPHPMLRATRRRTDLVRAVGIRNGYARWRIDRAHARVWNEQQVAVTRKLWREAASTLGIELRELPLTADGAPPVFEFRNGDRCVRVVGQRTPLATQPAVTIAADKPLTYRLLDEAGLPIPDHVVVDPEDVDRAWEFVGRGPTPCVVKPVAGRAGEGVIGSIRTYEQIRRALLHTTAHAALVERQLDGDHLRVIVLDGAVVAVLHRARPRVVGDGRSSVAELISREYERRVRGNAAGRVRPFRVGIDSVFTLAEQRLTIGDVPPAGTAVTVMTATNFGDLDDTSVYRGTIAEELAADAVRAADVLGLRLAGIDILTSDPAVPLETSGGAILDIEPTPGLHTLADEETTRRVVAAIVGSLFSSDRTG